MYRTALTRLLIVCLCVQTLTPPALATPLRPSPVAAAISNAPARAGTAVRHVLSTLALVEQSMVAFLRATLTPQDNWSVVLTPASTEFKEYAGLDYHHPTRKLLLSANNPGGQPNNFETVGADGSHSAFSNVAGLTGDILIATARDEGQGLSRGGFVSGEVFTTTGVPGSIARLNSSGATVQNPWVTLP
ncbi:MAG TPA: hypothetical protein VFT02_12190, partial [Pyrinomonadaceae bacterium]|nr:hypothetical protein [Pyrinomonadaceae bacterium]